MKFKFLILFALLAALAMLLAACGPAANAAELHGTSWKLVSYGPPAGAIPAESEPVATLSFGKDGKINGNSGCNSFSGDYTLNGDQITFGTLAATLMACSDPLMKQEAAVFSILNATQKYQVEAGVLTIFSANGEAVLKLVQVLK